MIQETTFRRIALSALVSAVVLAAPSWVLAQSDTSGESRDPIVAQPVAPPDNLPAVSEAAVDLSFNVAPETASALDGAKAEDDAGYLYFKTPQVGSQQSDLVWNPDSVTTFSPRAAESAATADNMDSLGTAWLRESFTPRSADAHLSFSYVRSKDHVDDAHKQLDIALSSRVRVDEVELPGVVNNPTLAAALNRQTYDIGLNVGYSGFNLGASVRGGESAFTNITSGYDVGFSYSGSSWSTSLLVGEYSRKYNNVFGDLIGKQTNFYALEFGASYSLNRAFRVSGGFRYLNFSKEAQLSLFERPQSQVFYLGTRLNF